MEDAKTFVYLYRCIITLLVVVLGFTYKKYLNRKINIFYGYILCVAISLYWAFRPIDTHYGLGDTKGYAWMFSIVSGGGDLEFKDVGFDFLIKHIPGTEVWLFFLVMAAIYNVGYLEAARRLTPVRFGVMFMLVVCSFSFTGYGLNGIRNGAAAALMMVGLSSQRIRYTALFALLAISLHKSLLLPVSAYVVSLFYNKTKPLLLFWVVCLILSFFAAGFLAEVIPWDEIMGDDRAAGYLNGTFEENDATFSHTGYRFDFVFYSFVPIYIAYKAITDGIVKSKLYMRLFTVYIICNAFWLFTIYIPYNNRFAYLSWFLYPYLIGIPFLTDGKWCTTSNIHLLILLNFSFTLIMWLI